ncbi:MAG TPA: hypothetical protein VEC16_05870 [Alphaproteobacteria bacterium]|nr:hypothetical protein [Alphaproteobacteria bacterium]
MTFDFEDHSWTIFNSRHDSLLVRQLWLEGYKHLCENTFVYSPSVNVLCETLIKKYPFTTFDSSEFQKLHSNLAYKMLFPAHLPVNESYHLAFWLELDPKYGDYGKIFFQENKDLDNKHYPAIDLRVNKLYEQNETPDTTVFFNGKEHDSVDCLLTNVYPDLLIECYTSFNDMIQSTRKSDRNKR